MPSITLEINNRIGLHARPATALVNEAKKYCSEISIRKGELTANAKSILGVLSLGLSKGSQAIISAEGEDAIQALEAIQALHAAHFGEED